MTVNRGDIFVAALAIGFGVFIAAGFECPVAKDPVSFIGDNPHSVIFMWDCSLVSNESVRTVSWFKESTVIAKAVGSTGNFTPEGSYAGRVERNGTFGILLHNISKDDSGHYNITVVLNTLEINIPPTCQSVYLPVLPAEVWKYNDWQHQLSPKDVASSLCGQEGASKLAIGLLCGLVPVTYLRIVFVSCFVYRKRRNTMQRGEIGVECLVTKDPVSFIGDNPRSVIFMWDFSLVPSEYVLTVSWLKESTVIANDVGSAFTPKGSYAGRMERNGTFGILLHNISKDDSGHYNITVLLNNSLENNNPPACQSVYLPEWSVILVSTHIVKDRGHHQQESLLCR